MTTRGRLLWLIAMTMVFVTLAAWRQYENRYGSEPFDTGRPTVLRWCGAEYSSDWAGATAEGTAAALSPLPLRKIHQVGTPFGSEYVVFVADGPTARNEAVGDRPCPMSLYLKTGSDHYVRYDIPA
jgi:hypothetical protein